LEIGLTGDLDPSFKLSSDELRSFFLASTFFSTLTCRRWVGGGDGDADAFLFSGVMDRDDAELDDRRFTTLRTSLPRRGDLEGEGECLLGAGEYLRRRGDLYLGGERDLRRGEYDLDLYLRLLERDRDRR